jgi:hypothetical protein
MVEPTDSSPTSFVEQNHHGIGHRCAAGWDVAGGRGHEHEWHGSDDAREQIFFVLPVRKRAL